MSELTRMKGIVSETQSTTEPEIKELDASNFCAKSSCDDYLPVSSLWRENPFRVDM